MKKYFILAAFAGLFLGGCKDDEFGPVLKIGNAPAFTAPAANASFVLTESKANDEFAKFTWSAADFGYEAGVSYSIEMDKAGNNFADPINIGTVNALKLEGVTNGKINNILLGKGLPGETPTDVEFRIAAKVSAEVPVVYSAALKVSVTPYTVVIVYPQLQVPGSYQGWDPTNNKTVIFSVKSDDKYEGYVNFPDAGAEYKYTKGPSWDTNWGDTGANGSLDKGGDNIKLTDAGVYKLNVDLNALTHSFTKTDWGVIGTATADDWNSDQNMTFDAAANKSLEYNGDNIAVAEAGNYTIDLILSGAVYTYKLKKN